MTHRFAILAQYYENYGFSVGKEYWKPKMGHTFIMELEEGDAMGIDITELAKRVCETQSNAACKYEFVEWNSYHDPTVLSVADMRPLVEEAIEKTRKWYEKYRDE